LAQQRARLRSASLRLRIGAFMLACITGWTPLSGLKEGQLLLVPEFEHPCDTRRHALAADSLQN
jgi:hypothetical protein